MDVTERLLNTKVVFFLEFLRFAVEFFAPSIGNVDSFGKV